MPTSLPPPSQPALGRRLGTGKSSRTLRVQMTVAVVAGLVMIAVPLYVWRRPRATDADRRPDATGQSGLSPMLSATAPAATAPVPLPPETRGLSLGEPRISRCQKSGGKTPPEQCDRQPFFEEALTKSIRDNVSCAPMLPSGGTINFVLDVDFKTKKTKVWAGKSGSVKKRAAREVVSCVTRGLPTPDWAQVPHQHTKYSIVVLATYPPSGGAGGP
ncbi:MAG: hypothetical protein IT374_14410 [Polyangiaceae bacterium]|nr:hypothetical protein [Polyangiaceae bacterium]